MYTLIGFQQDFDSDTTTCPFSSNYNINEKKIGVLIRPNYLN